jgi:hypothetical protein
VPGATAAGEVGASPVPPPQLRQAAQSSDRLPGPRAAPAGQGPAARSALPRRVTPGKSAAAHGGVTFDRKAGSPRQRYVGFELRLAV